MKDYPSSRPDVVLSTQLNEFQEQISIRSTRLAFIESVKRSRSGLKSKIFDKCIKNVTRFPLLHSEICIQNLYTTTEEKVAFVRQIEVENSGENAVKALSNAICAHRHEEMRLRHRGNKTLLRRLQNRYDEVSKTTNSSSAYSVWHMNMISDLRDNYSRDYKNFNNRRRKLRWDISNTESRQMHEPKSRVNLKNSIITRIVSDLLENSFNIAQIQHLCCFRIHNIKAEISNWLMRGSRIVNSVIIDVLDSIVQSVIIDILTSLWRSYKRVSLRSQQCSTFLSLSAIHTSLHSKVRTRVLLSVIMQLYKFDSMQCVKNRPTRQAYYQRKLFLLEKEQIQRSMRKFNAKLLESISLSFPLFEQLERRNNLEIFINLPVIDRYRTGANDFRNISYVPSILSAGIDSVSSLRFSNCHRYLCAGSFSGKLFIWETDHVQFPSEYISFPVSTKSIRNLEWSWDVSSVLFSDAIGSVMTMNNPFSSGGPPCAQLIHRSNSSHPVSISRSSLCIFNACMTVFGTQNYVTYSTLKGDVVRTTCNSQTSQSVPSLYYRGIVDEIDAFNFVRFNHEEILSRSSHIEEQISEVDSDELFRGHEDAIIFMSFVSDTDKLMTIDRSNYLSIWPHTKQNLTGFGWFEPAVTYCLDFSKIRSIEPVSQIGQTTHPDIFRTVQKMCNNGINISHHQWSVLSFEQGTNYASNYIPWLEYAIDNDETRTIYIPCGAEQDYSEKIHGKMPSRTCFISGDSSNRSDLEVWNFRFIQVKDTSIAKVLLSPDKASIYVCVLLTFSHGFRKTFPHLRNGHYTVFHLELSETNNVLHTRNLKVNLPASHDQTFPLQLMLTSGAWTAPRDEDAQLSNCLIYCLGYNLIQFYSITMGYISNTVTLRFDTSINPDLPSSCKISLATACNNAELIACVAPKHENGNGMIIILEKNTSQSI